MGGDIRVENDREIEAMVNIAKLSYEKARTYYEARKEALAKAIAQILEKLNQHEAKLNNALSALGNCQHEIAQTEEELVRAREKLASAREDGTEEGMRAWLTANEVTSLEQKLTKLQAQKEYLVKLSEYHQRSAKECEEKLEMAVALKKD